MSRSDDPTLALAAQIVSAHVENNATAASALPALIRDVYNALAGLGGGHAAAPAPAQASSRYVAEQPAAPARGRPAATGQTVFDDHLVCLDCGLQMKMLKRHLATVHQLSPAQYRSKWRLPGDYPMVARQYAALRSNLAKESGLGKRPISRGR